MSAASREADGPAEKADLLHAIYERITVAGPEIVGVRLTTSAYAYGFALALPDEVELARPTRANTDRISFRRFRGAIRGQFPFRAWHQWDKDRHDPPASDLDAGTSLEQVFSSLGSP